MKKFKITNIDKPLVCFAKNESRMFIQNFRNANFLKRFNQERKLMNTKLKCKNFIQRY